MTMDGVSKELCNERSGNIEKGIVSINENIKTIYNRLNWFYIMAIGTLASGLSSLIIGIVLLSAK